MIRSMTGYGDFDEQNEYAHIYVEIKSLNSRFFEFYPRTCKALSVYDNEIKNKIKSICVRGNFQLKTKIEFQCIEKTVINKDKIINYIDIQNEILKIAPDIGKISMDKLMGMTDIYQHNNIDDSLIKSLYFNCVDEAIIQLNKSRIDEGNNIGTDLNKNLKNIEDGMNVISNLYKDNTDFEFEKYKNKINNILEDVNIKEDRLYQEIAILIDKKDINEELVRLNSHIKILNNYFLEDNEIGKKINFLLQEIGREINTISSKSANIEIIHQTLTMKNELEKIREQVQNIL